MRFGKNSIGSQNIKTFIFWTSVASIAVIKENAKSAYYSPRFKRLLLW